MDGFSWRDLSALSRYWVDARKKNPSGEAALRPQSLGGDPPHHANDGKAWAFPHRSSTSSFWRMGFGTRGFGDHCVWAGLGTFHYPFHWPPGASHLASGTLGLSRRADFL